MQIDDDLKAARGFRLPWWGGLCVAVGAFLASALSDHFGRLDLAVPTVASIVTLAYAIMVKWRLRRHMWFWVTMVIVLALHFLVLFSVSWSAKWVPAVVVLPIAIAD